MNDIDQNNLYFAVPHAFFELAAGRYTLGEAFFYIVLRKMISQLNRGYEWALLFDAPGPASDNRRECFSAYDVFSGACKSARKKLLADGLIVTRYARNRKGHRIGTEYKLLDDGFSRLPKAVHQRILGQLGRGDADGGFEGKGRPLGEFSGVVEASSVGDISALDK